MINPSFYIVTASGKTASPPVGSCTVALGTFDGVHIAHRELLRRTVELKKSLGASLCGAWCFAESPANLLGDKKSPALCTLEKKIDMMLSLGLDFVAVGDFRDFRDISAEDFVNEFLKGTLGCVGTVCGFNHRFGHKGKGTSSLLAEAFGNDCAVMVDEIKCDDETVSSTAIKAHILNGNVEKAALMLGRPFSLTAKVTRGKNLGHTVGFPTANQDFPEGTIIPKRGIYATLCTTSDGKRHVGISNIGIRPTITDGSDDHVINCETHIHDFSENIYGDMISVEFHKYLREEKKFASIKDLCDQIAKDLETSISYFKEKEDF